MNIKIFKYLYENGGKYLYLDESTFSRNIHSTNTSSNIEHQFQRVIQVVQRYFEIDKQKTFLADFLLYNGRQLVKNKQFKKGMYCIVRSQFYSFDIHKRLIKKLIK